MKKPYDQKDPKDIERYSQKIVGKTLRDFMTDEDIEKLNKNKGGLGTAIEEYFFKITPGSFQGPDFKEAGVELKTTGLKESQGKWKAKERLVLGMIDYNAVHLEEFETSSLLNKSSLILVMFYLYKKTSMEIDFIDFVIKMSTLFHFPEKDLRIIKDDWETIVRKVRAGKAHEISEGDTFYLGACTKAQDSARRRTQPFSDILAKPRAFSLKAKYLDVIYTRSVEAEPIVSEVDAAEEIPIEELILEKFSPFYGLSVAEIHRRVGGGLNRSSKSYFASLTLRMLGVQKAAAEEFVKADITVKTIRLTKAGMPKEAISFPNFKYIDIVEQAWDDSSLKEQLEKKFLFVIYQYDVNNKLFFKKAMFWNMPHSDLVEAQKTWEETVSRIKSGDAHNLSKASETYNVHVRPHARNSQDTYDTPWGEKVVKKCFWLNQRYVKEQVEKGS